MNCTVATVLARTAASAVPCAPRAPTPGAQALCQKLAASIGEQDNTSELISKVITALQHLIIGDVRATGLFVLDGLVRFKRTEIKARPTEYAYNAYYGKVILRTAKGAHRRVYGRAPWPIGCIETPTSPNLRIQEIVSSMVQAALQDVFAGNQKKGLKRRARISRAVELQQHGYTDGCPVMRRGCCQSCGPLQCVPAKDRGEDARG